MNKKLGKLDFVSTRKFSIVLFCVSLFLFTWPFLAGLHAYPVKMFKYLFTVWGLIIICLFLMSKYGTKKQAGQDDVN